MAPRLTRRVSRDVPQDQLDAALAVVVECIGPEAVIGAYLYGSAVAGGLRPDSDLDLFFVTRQRMELIQKRCLIDGLLPISGRETRPAGWRPLELTVVVQSDVRPWRYPPRWDLQYGEWMRQQFLAGEEEPWPTANPDLAVLVTMVRASGRALRGPDPEEVLEPVPPEDLVRAMTDEIPQLLGDLDSDTRNVLLTLARIWATLETGRILSKDAAAAWVIERLPDPYRAPLEEARRLYLDGGYVMRFDAAAVRALAEDVIDKIRQRAGSVDS